MKIKLLCILLGAMVLMISCQKNKNVDTNQVDPNSHKITVVEVEQSDRYTYLNVQEEEEKYWIAINKMHINVGETYYYRDRLEMSNFESKELSRTFDTIYFIQELSTEPINATATQAPQGMPPHMPQGGKKPAEKADVKLTPLEGGITIAQLFANPDQYAGKVIKVKGQVVKFNTQIMGRNWVHIQDGTEHSGNFDLTITTQDQVGIGDVVIFEGAIHLNKDFGAGYKYDIIMEEGKLQEYIIS